MYILIAFFLAAVISFFGSVLLGLVNVAVIDTAIRQNAKSARWLALGGVVPEIPYTLIAILGTSYIDQLKDYQHIIGSVVGVIFIVLGFSYMFKNGADSKEKKQTEVNDEGKKSNFFIGLFLALANPQLIFFWSAVVVFIKTGTLDFILPSQFELGISSPNAIYNSIAFAIGASGGAFAILAIYIRLACHYREQLTGLIGDKLSNVVGLVFISLGVIAIVKNAI